MTKSTNILCIIHSTLSIGIMALINVQSLALEIGKSQ